MKQIPNLFTLLNLFFGCIAIVCALQTESVFIYVNESLETTFNIPEKLALASVFIGVAAVIDFLDGVVARLMNASSEMGKQLDSLADVVSFGVAPGVILFQLLRFSYVREENGFDVSQLALVPAFIVSCCAAYRLAKFNLDTEQTYYFKGLPTPAMGMLVASFPLIIHYPSGWLNLAPLIINQWFLYAVILILSYLMVSNIPMMSLKFKDKSIKNNLPVLLLLHIAVISIILLKWSAVPVVFLAYILLSLVFKNKLR
ncbi:CDP-alcohol phosphatidyltransferase family protein [soil metagenome]